MGQNKHGLKRHLPESVARSVRQRCGYGCVVCGDAIAQYDHFDPEFSEAREHRPEGIALLCPNHHTKKGTLLSPESYLRAIEAPAAIKGQQARTGWDLSKPPRVALGRHMFQGSGTILRIDGELMLGFEPPEEPGAAVRLTTRFFDRDGQESLSVEQNVVTLFTESYDIEGKANRFTVRSGPKRVDLEVCLQPPDLVVVEKLHWRRDGWGLDVSADETRLTYKGEVKGRLWTSGRTFVEDVVLFDCAKDGEVRTRVSGTIRCVSDPRLGPPKPPALEVKEFADGRVQWVYPSSSDIEAARAEFEERVRQRIREQSGSD